MSNQEIFEALSELECALFYRQCREEAIEEVHKLVNEALVKFAEVTGMHN